jgi:outer membrane protein assembly factor BamC
MPHFKTKLLALAVGATVLSGCSSFSKALNWGDSVWGSSDKNYREQEEQLAEKLEVPPTLVRPKSQQMGLLNGKYSEALAKGGTASDIASLSKADIPSYKAKGIHVKGNLCERWLELDNASADNVWVGVQKFLRSLGYPIQEANRATGIIRTEYVPRKEVVPLVDVSPLTKLFNSWRPETAEGAMDRFTVHVTVDGQTGKAKVLFHHHQVFHTDDGDIDVYRVKPYDPVKELEMLYQSAIFFGAKGEQAFKQVAVSAKQMEIVKGSEFAGLILHAPLSEAWAYVQSMIWRADWNVEKVIPERHQLIVRLDEKQEDKSFWSSLAFWRSSANLPKRVLLTLKPAETQPNHTELTVSALEGDAPLTAEQRKQIFAKLGLLGE